MGEFRLTVLFAEPLVIVDQTGVAYPIPLLDTEAELELLFEALKETAKAVEVELAPATSQSFLTALNRGVEVLHFTGHGSNVGLAFEGEIGDAHFITGDLIRSFLEAQPNPQLKVIFLSACDSEDIGMALVAAGIPFVISVRRDGSVSETAARTFVRAFYEALFSGQSVEQAFESGRAAVLGSPALVDPENEAGHFLLHSNGRGGDTTGILSAGPGESRVNAISSPTTLPGTTDTFLGRQVEMHEIVVSLQNHRLVTVRGAPGIGKSALAVSVANYLRKRALFPNGSYFVSARSASSAEAVLYGIAQALGLERAQFHDVALALGDSRCLIFLDNLEDTIINDARSLQLLLSDLLGACPGLRILATSRVAIGSGVESASERVLNLLRLNPIDAARLFERRAPRPISPDEVGAATDEDVATSLSQHPIMAYLAGHPLAIVLAAALLDSHSLDELQSRLGTERAAILVSEAVPAEERDAQTSVYASLRVSLQHLLAVNPRGASFFRFLGLLPGGAREIDLDSTWQGDWGSLVRLLIRFSLVDRTERPAGTRTAVVYVMHPLVSEFALTELSESDHLSLGLDVAAHFAGVVEAIQQRIYSREAPEARDVFSIIEENLSACLLPSRPILHAGPNVPKAPIAVIGVSLAQILLQLTRPLDAARAAERAIPMIRQSSDVYGLVNALHLLGTARTQLREFELAEQALVEATRLYGLLENRQGVAEVSRSIGELRIEQGQFSDAREILAAAVLEFRNLVPADLFGVASTLATLGRANMFLHDEQATRSCFDEALQLFKQIGEEVGWAGVCHLYGKFFLLTNDFDRAEQSCRDAERILRERHVESTLSSVLCTLARVLRTRPTPDLHGARVAIVEALKINEELGGGISRAELLQELGNLDAKEKHFDEGFRALDEAARLYARANLQLAVGATFNDLAQVVGQQGNLEDCLRLSDAALRIHRAHGQWFHEFTSLSIEGRVFEDRRLARGLFATTWLMSRISIEHSHGPSQTEYDQIFSNLLTSLRAPLYFQMLADMVRNAEQRRIADLEFALTNTVPDPRVAALLRLVSEFE